MAKKAEYSARTVLIGLTTEVVAFLTVLAMLAALAALVHWLVG